MRTNNFIIRKLKDGFRGLAAVLPSFSMALAVFAAAGMAAAGCDSLTGAGNGYDGAASAEAAASAPESTGGIMASSAQPRQTKTIKVKFEVLNGGWGGLKRTEGFVSTQDDRYLRYGEGFSSEDYTIKIIAPASDEYLNVYWMAHEPLALKATHVWIKAKMKPESGTITFDYNGNDGEGYPEVVTKNLYDVELLWEKRYGDSQQPRELWAYLKKRVADNEVKGTRTIKVKFEVLNGGYGLLNSYGIVSTQDDGYLVYDHDTCANDFTITIPVPPEDEYLNIRWKGTDIWHCDTCVNAKMKAESGTITLDYNGHKKVATKNLYDVRTGNFPYDWKSAENRAVSDETTITGPSAQ